MKYPRIGDHGYRTPTTVLFLLFSSYAWSFTPSFTSKNRIRIQTSVEVSDDLYLDHQGIRQLQIFFSCDDVTSDELSELLLEVGVLSVSVEVESERPDVLNLEERWSDLGTKRSWATAILRANFPASFDAVGLQKLIRDVFPGVPMESKIVDVEERDWVMEVQMSWPPQVIGDLTIRFPWHDPVSTDTPLELVLEGGSAFGTGDHPTTRLCCQWLRDHARIPSSSVAGENIGPRLRGVSLLDYGCGSGILGLAALRYGAARAVGTEIDRDALISAQLNARGNGLEFDLFEVDDSSCTENTVLKVSPFRGNAAGVPTFPPVTELAATNEKFDVTVANILAPILIRLAPELAGYTKKGGFIALSGVIAVQAQSVIDAFIPFFPDVRVEAEEDGWVLISGTKDDS